MIVVVGPPKVGKSTLIRCLIKNFTRQKLGEICGPVTVVSGKYHYCNTGKSELLKDLIENVNNLDFFYDFTNLFDTFFNDALSQIVLLINNCNYLTALGKNKNNIVPVFV